jgi:hypothetical protein
MRKNMHKIDCVNFSIIAENKNAAASFAYRKYYEVYDHLKTKNPETILVEGEFKDEHWFRVYPQCDWFAVVNYNAETGKEDDYA